MKDQHKYRQERGKTACKCGWRGETASQREWLGHIQSVHERKDNRKWN